MQSEHEEHGCVLAIDYGTVRVGLAVSDAGKVAKLRRSTDGTVKFHSRRVHAEAGVRNHAALAGLVLLLISEFETWFAEHLDGD